MINIYRKYLPGEKSLTRILLKSLFGVFLGAILFSIFLLAYLGVAGFNDSNGVIPSIYELFDIVRVVIVGAMLWTLVIASPPTVLASYLLAAIIYRDFKQGNISKASAIKTGSLVAGLIGLSVSLFVIFIVFRNHNSPRMLLFSIPVILIASLIGAWGGLQVHKEIASEFLSNNEIKENNQ